MDLVNTRQVMDSFKGAYFDQSHSKLANRLVKFWLKLRRTKNYVHPNTIFIGT